MAAKHKKEMAAFEKAQVALTSLLNQVEKCTNSTELAKLEKKQQDLKATRTFTQHHTVVLSDLNSKISKIIDTKNVEFAKLAEIARQEAQAKLDQKELKFYKQKQIPIPRKCFNCRHSERITSRNLPFLYERKCQNCKATIKTTFSPGRKEIVYCEKCYQQEVY